MSYGGNILFLLNKLKLGRLKSEVISLIILWYKEQGVIESVFNVPNVTVTETDVLHLCQ